MDKKILIFDFDGTIADTFRYFVMISNLLAKEFGFKSILTEDVPLLQDKSSPEILRFLKVPIPKIPRIVLRAKEELNKQIISVQPIAGLKETLLRLKSQENKLGILTSNSQENVLDFLKNHSLDIFDFIRTTSRIWGKNIGLVKIMRNFHFSRDQMLYIGDEIRDIVSARRAGIKVASVTWGYNSAQALAAYKPDYLINRPEELLGIVLH